MVNSQSWAAALMAASMLTACGSQTGSDAQQSAVTVPEPSPAVSELGAPVPQATRSLTSEDEPASARRPAHIQSVDQGAALQQQYFQLASLTTEGDSEEAVTDSGGARNEIDVFDFVQARARRMANEDYVAPPEAPAYIRNLDYNDYRRIGYRRDSALFDTSVQPFRVMLDSRGSLFQTEIGMNVVTETSLDPINFNPADFNFHDLEISPAEQSGLGLAGFRLLAPLNQSGRFDEVMSVKGASFFRALGAGNHYGTSARGIAVNTASAEGEEFPVFSEFWMEEPGPNDQTFVFYALLDGPSVTGAYEFHVRPGVQTQIDVSAVVFAREETDQIGLAPLTSMFEFAPQDPQSPVTDFRPRVHDSEGLSAVMSNGEWVWRPLTNPSTLQISSFASEVPMGFGLMQRTRDYNEYQDIEGEYEARPSVWVTPGEGWRAGQLMLVEIPTPNEYNDNIISYWRLNDALMPGQSIAFDYSMSWGMDAPFNSPLANVHATRVGQAEGNSGRRLFVVDFEIADLDSMEELEPVVSASAGEVFNVVATPDRRNGLLRVSFELRPPNSGAVELRALLNHVEEPVSETWLYRWSPA